MRGIKKILVIKNDKIGDMVLSTNIFRELRKNFPKSNITVIASKSNKPLIEENKNINKIMILDYPPNNYGSFLNYIKTSRVLKKENFDVGIDLRGSIFNIAMLHLANVKYKIGFYNRFFSKFFLDYAYKKDRLNKHVTFQRIDLINKALNLKSRDYWPEISTDKKDREFIDSFIKMNKLKRFICIVPDASLESKQLPLDRFNDVIRYINKNYKNYKIILLGLDKRKIAWLKRRNNFIISPSRLLNLRAIYLLFKKSELVIAHDGGPMHLAWAARTRLVALIPAHLSLNYTRPLGKNVRVISDIVQNIKTERVIKEIDNLIKN